MNRPGLKLVVVDDHPLFLSALVQVLEQIDFVEVVAKYNKPQYVLPYILNHPVDVLITDLSMPEMDGLELSTLVKAQRPDLSIIVVSMLNEANKTLNLMDIGIAGYLLKNAPKTDYEHALNVVSQGKCFFSSELTQKIKQAKQQEHIKLTPRESEVLELIASELTNQEIADRLFVSSTTVISHRKRLLQKFNARNTAGLIKKAMNQDFI
ncbi:MAG: response regulator [Flavobacteriales bacterium]